jgi:hypothetical protein
MSSPSPHTSPSAPISDTSRAGTESLETLNRLARAQRYVILALLVLLVAYALMLQVVGYALGGLFFYIALWFLRGALLIPVVAGVQLAAALRFSVVSRVLVCIALLIPVVDLLILGMLSSRASQRLRAGGFKVGLLGAKPREA